MGSICTLWDVKRHKTSVSPGGILEVEASIATFFSSGTIIFLIVEASTVAYLQETCQTAASTHAQLVSTFYHRFQGSSPKLGPLSVSSLSGWGLKYGPLFYGIYWA